MLNSIGNTALVRCRVVVRFSEGPLSEAAVTSAPSSCAAFTVTVGNCYHPNPNPPPPPP